MKYLLKRTGVNLFKIADTLTGDITEMTSYHIQNNKEKITGLRVTREEVSVAYGYTTVQGNKLFLLESLVEGTIIVGFIAYLNTENKIIYVGLSKAVNLAQKLGVTNGSLLKGYKGQYISTRVPRVKATVHKQLYMDMYRNRKQDAMKQGHTITEKIVRSSLDTLEMRQMAPLLCRDYVGPSGVNVFKLKWWKIIGDNLYLLERPKIKNLDISSYTVSIEYVGLPKRLDGLMLSGTKSLGCFSECEIETLYLGNLLQKIGKEAFKHNKLSSLFVPINVGRIEEEAFSGNFLAELLFVEGSALYHLGDRCFERNNLSMIILPKSLEEIGEGCFENNSCLFSVEFEDLMRCKLTEIKSRTFADCDIESILLPNSICKVARDAFDGCNNFRRIQILETSRLCNEKFITEWSNRGVIVDILSI